MAGRQRRLIEALRAASGRPLMLDVLDEVCQTRLTESAVALTNDLVRRGRLSRWGDPLGLVTTMLEALNADGFVVYTVRDSIDDDAVVPRNIRSTGAGFAHAGYRLRSSEVGSSAWRRSHPGFDPKSDGGIRHPGDATDYRTHRPSAIGMGPIETLPLEQHMARYRDHAELHEDQLDELYEGEMMARHQVQNGGRPGKYSDAMLAQMWRERQQGVTFRELARRHGVPLGSMFDVLVRAERVAGQDLDFRTVESAVNKGHEPWSSVRRPTATPEPEEATETPEPEEATEAPAEVVSESETTPEPEWPVLTDLLSRQDERAAVEARAGVVLDAAAALEQIGDAETARALEMKAEAMVSDFRLSRAEDEFIRYYRWASAQLAERA